MKRQALLANLSPSLKIIVLILLVLVSLMFMMVLGLAIAIPIWGFDIFAQLNQMQLLQTDEMLAFSKYFQIVSHLGLFVVPCILFAFFVNRHVWSYLALLKNVKASHFVYALLVIVAILPFINWMAEWNAGLTLPEWLHGVEQWMKDSETNAKFITERFLSVDTIGGFLLNVFMIALLPAIGEEFLFRGILQRLFSEWFKNMHVAVLLSAFIFSAFHLQFYGFIPRMFLGILFGYMFIWSGSLWIPIFAHFINNVSITIAYYLFHKGIIETNVEEIGTFQDNAIPVLLSVLLLTGLMLLFFKNKPATWIRTHSEFPK